MHSLQLSFSFKNYSLITALLFSANFAHAATSPLVNEQQKALDQRAVQINQNWNYPVLKAEAKAAYVAAHGSPLSSEAKELLNLAINELAFSALQKAVNDDPKYPKVYSLNINTAPHQAAGVSVADGRYSYDNTDTIYRTTPISGDNEYVVYGKRNNVAPTDVTFSLIKKPNSQQTIAYLSGKDLVVNADGSYIITIDNKPANGRKNHIQSNNSAKQLFVRNTLGNWNTETPDNLTVKRVNPLPTNIAPLVSVH